MSQRMQSFVLDPALNPFNVVEPGKRPRVTLTPGPGNERWQTIYFIWRTGRRYTGSESDPVLCKHGDFGMTVQESVEAANINTYQYYLSLAGRTVSQNQVIFCYKKIHHPGTTGVN
jgi:gamma-glutamyltranspeptidase/glutathione hydrolase